MNDRSLQTTILPDGSNFPFWERPIEFEKTYYVDCNSPTAADSGPGTQKQPFKTIGKAAKVLKSHERVIIQKGTYRECVSPQRGGDGPDSIISYEAAPDACVVIKGSNIVEGDWEKSTGWNFIPRRPIDIKPEGVSVWKITLDGSGFHGYNPFNILNIMQDKQYLACGKVDMTPFFKKRGMIFVDGKPLEQVLLFRELGENDERFWVEDNGLVLHIRFPGDDNPERHVVEVTTREQVFAPQEYELAYIRI